MSTPLKGRGMRPRRSIGGRFLQCPRSAVKMWAAVGKRVAVRQRAAEPRSVLVVAGDLLDQIDDAAAQLGVLDPHEGLGQRQAVGGREKIGDIGGRGRFGRCRPALPGDVRRAFEEERRPAPAECARSAAAGSRRCGSCPSRISAPAGKSGRARRRASPGSCQHHPAHAHAAAHMLVDRFGAFLAIITISYAAFDAS